MIKENIVFLSLGTNVSNQNQFNLAKNIDNQKKSALNTLKNNLDEAINSLNKDGKIITLSTSSIYLTEPFDMKTNNWFLNQVIKIQTVYSPLDLIVATQNIEQIMGKLSNHFINNQKVYIDRIIDLDIISFNEDIINFENLIIPHKLMHERLFVLSPLLEIEPTWIHPVLKVSINHLIENISSKFKNLECKKLNNLLEYQL